MTEFESLLLRQLANIEGAINRQAALYEKWNEEFMQERRESDNYMRNRDAEVMTAMKASQADLFIKVHEMLGWVQGHNTRPHHECRHYTA